MWVWKALALMPPVQNQMSPILWSQPLLMLNALMAAAAVVAAVALPNASAAVVELVWIFARLYTSVDFVLEHDSHY